MQKLVKAFWELISPLFLYQMVPALKAGVGLYKEKLGTLHKAVLYFGLPGGVSGLGWCCGGCREQNRRAPLGRHT